jgi:hypothetical protein
MKKYYEVDRDEYIKLINDILSETSDIWVLWQIYLSAFHITDEGKVEITA